MATTTKPTTNPQAPTEDELNARIETELAAQVERELEAEMGRKRAEIVRRLRREAFSKEMDRINQRHPIQDRLAGLTPEQDAERQRVMREGSRRDAESMARSNSRPVEGSLLHQRSRASIGPGSEGFRTKPPGGA
jgi:hypothetical protein